MSSRSNDRVAFFSMAKSAPKMGIIYVASSMAKGKILNVVASSYNLTVTCCIGGYTKV
jgi:hypothetical protein